LAGVGFARLDLRQSYLRIALPSVNGKVKCTQVAYRRPHQYEPTRTRQSAAFLNHYRKSPQSPECVVGPGAVSHANVVNSLRVKQSRIGPLSANTFLGKCQNRLAMSPHPGSTPASTVLERKDRTLAV